MKKLIFAAIALISIATLASCQDEGTAKAKDSGNGSDDISYAFGVSVGKSISSTGVSIDYKKFLDGVKDVMDKNAPKMTDEQIVQILQTAITAAESKKADEKLKTETDFLASNGKKDGVVTTASGLQYQVITEGSGSQPKATDTVKVNYVGTLLDGTTFDSTLTRGEPADLPLNRVIPGWNEGIQLMKVGGKTKFWIPSSLAYGSTGAGGGKIGPNETLVFEVELLDIVPPAK